MTSPASVQVEVLLQRARAYFGLPGVIKKSKHTYKSGGEGPFYFDFDYIINEPSRCEEIAAIFASKIQSDILSKKQVDFLGFIEKYDNQGTTGAIRLSGLISSYTRIPNVVLSLSKEISTERVKVPREKGVPSNQRLTGSLCTIVTDHATTGLELLDAIDAVEGSGARVTDLIAYSIFSKQFEPQRPEFEKRGITVHNIFRIPEDTEVAGNETAV